MKILSEVLKIDTHEKLELVDITERVVEFMKNSNIKDGFINLFSLHTTTALFLNEVQTALLDDIRAFLHKIVDDNVFYKHNSPEYSDCDRKNAASHLRGLLIGPSLSLQIDKGKLVLGTFQSIIFAELDGPRERQLQIQLIGI
jgi:secondary thiamine-phosphate synthase enzyme